jgi:putative peptidoglycan lipid II flippase
VILAWTLMRAGYAGTHAGLALATSIAALLNAWLLWRGLRRDGVVGVTSGWPALLVRFLIANAAMAASLLQLARPLEWWLQSGLMARSTWLAVTIATGAGVYFAALLLAGVRPAQLRLKAG